MIFPLTLGKESNGLFRLVPGKHRMEVVVRIEFTEKGCSFIHNSTNPDIIWHLNWIIDLLNQRIESERKDFKDKSRDIMKGVGK